MKRREALSLIGLATLAPLACAQQAATPIEIWRSPTCGCCGGWIKHLESNGFVPKVNMVSDTSAARNAAGIPVRLASCHTAKVANYGIEGHVPASDIRRLLAERPSARGLAAPGMPARAPGMDVPGAGPYDVLLIANDESTTVYAHHI
jgi:hypothetical protein